MALSDAFKNLKPGDLIQTADDKGGRTLVALRQTVAGRFVLGHVCKCGTHVDSIERDTYSWSPTGQCLVTDMGQVPPWWSEEITKEPGEGARFLTEDVLGVPVISEFPWISNRHLAELLEGQKTFFDRVVAVKRLGNLDDKSFVLYLLKQAGVVVNDEQANLVFGALAMIQRAEEVHSIFGLIGAILGQVEGEPSARQGMAH